MDLAVQLALDVGQQRRVDLISVGRGATLLARLTLGFGLCLLPTRFEHRAELLAGGRVELGFTRRSAWAAGEIGFRRFIRLLRGNLILLFSDECLPIAPDTLNIARQG